MKTEIVAELKSSFGLIWRGLKRSNDRELAIAGSEWIIIDLKTNEVLAVQRNFGRTGFNRNTKEGIWWLNALGCPKLHQRNILSKRFYDFAIRSLKPSEKK